MQLHELQRKTSNPRKKRMGRGGKRGKTAGRGHKGQRARAGHKVRPEVRDTIKKLPKLRGYRFNSIKRTPFAINVSKLAQAFSNKETVNRKTLQEKNIITGRAARMNPIKILGSGDIDISLRIEGCSVSKTAEEKITKAGGSIHDKQSANE